MLNQRKAWIFSEINTKSVRIRHHIASERIFFLIHFFPIKAVPGQEAPQFKAEVIRKIEKTQTARYRDHPAQHYPVSRHLNPLHPQPRPTISSQIPITFPPFHISKVPPRLISSLWVVLVCRLRRWWYLLEHHYEWRVFCVFGRILEAECYFE